MEEIFGYVENIVFASEEAGFTVAKLKEPKKADLTCIVGYMPSLQPGETVRCQGLWKHHPQHGRQFEVKAFESQAPADLVGIQKYLESGMIKGIGAVYAERIVQAFGLNTLDVIDKTPEKLLEVAGIGKRRVETIRTYWDAQKSIRTVMIFLRGHGISPSFAQKIFKTYGEKSIEKVQENPYALAKDVFGIGFKMADQIAANLGVGKNAPERVRAGIEHVLWELSNEGHTCYPFVEFLTQAQAVLEVEKEDIEKECTYLLQEGRLFKDEEKIWLKPLYLAELSICRELARLHKAASHMRSVDIEKALSWVQGQLKLELAPEQKEAVQAGLKEKILLITGGPGTGKSTITRGILAITEKLTPRILLAAPTGRAAKRMSEITRKKAFTIHALLEMNFAAGGFKKNRENPLECDLLIVDEASMIDTLLMHHLLKAIPSQARLILIGDVDQLPSVGAGKVLKDLISSEKLPVALLKQIFRQAAGSKIITNAHKVNQGEFPDLSSKGDSDFFFIHRETPEAILETIIDLVKVRLPKRYRFHRFEEIQVLSPMKKGVIGTENLNIELQKHLNPSPSPLVRMGRSFHVGDKVMQVRNNYQKLVYNGDIGKIVSIEIADQVLTVAFEERVIEYEFNEIDELVLAYGVSIHKYQGSECPCIVIPVHTTHFKLLYRNLLYTGITRGKKLVVLVGTPKAVGIAIQNKEALTRFTGLKERMGEFFPGNTI